MTQTTRRVTNTFRYEKLHSKSDDDDDDDVISNAPRLLLSLHFERELFSSQKGGGFAFFVFVFFFVFLLLLVRDFGRTDFHRVERQERNRLDATPGD
jgi:hypothetical protein